MATREFYSFCSSSWPLPRAAAAANGRAVPEHLLKAADLAVKDELEEEGEEKKAGGGTFMDLFRPNKMALRTLNMSFQWFSATM